jgi:hypothetical protein
MPFSPWRDPSSGEKPVYLKLGHVIFFSFAIRKIIPESSTSRLEKNDQKLGMGKISPVRL